MATDTGDPTDLDLDPELVEEAAQTARDLIGGGYLTADEVAEALAEIYEESEGPSPLDQARAQRIVAPLWAARLAEQAAWPERTDVDALEAVFAALERRAIVARDNFACCAKCGHGEIRAEAGPDSAGYVFFHQQTTTDPDCSTDAARRRSESRRPDRTAGRTTSQPSRPSAPPGTVKDSIQVSTLPPDGAGPTRKAPVPRISRPVWSTSHRFGGSQAVITIVSRKPIRPKPVHASTRPPTPCPSSAVARTRVPSIQVLWCSQSVSASQTFCSGASTCWVNSSTTRDAAPGRAPGGEPSLLLLPFSVVIASHYRPDPARTVG